MYAEAEHPGLSSFVIGGGRGNYGSRPNLAMVGVQEVPRFASSRGLGAAKVGSGVLVVLLVSNRSSTTVLRVDLAASLSMVWVRAHGLGCGAKCTSK